METGNKANPEAAGSLIRPVGWAGLILGAFVACVGAWHLAGWLTGHFSNTVFSQITMKTNTALSLTLCGMSVVLLMLLPFHKTAIWAVRFFSVVIFTIGLLSFIENISGLNFHIDQLIATELPGAPSVSSPNRMGTSMALGLTLAGLAQVLLSLRRPLVKSAQLLALTVLLIGLLGALGFLYEARPLYTLTRATSISFSAAVGLIALGIALLCVYPAKGFMSAVTSESLGGHTIRYLLPWCVGLPLVVGYLEVRGEQRGYLDIAMGTASVTLLLVFALAILVYRNGLVISGREASELRIREMFSRSEERYRTLFTNMTEGFALGEVIPNDEGDPCSFKFIEINNAFEQHTGLKRESVVGVPITEALPKIEPQWINVYCKVAMTGESARFEQYNRDTDRHYSVSCFSPSPGQFAILFYDVSDRKKSEDRLRQMAERFSLAQRAGRVGVFDWDLTTGSALWTSEMEDIFGVPHGLPDARYRWEGWARYVHPDDLERIEAYFSEWLKTDRKEGEWEYRYFRGGEERWIAACGSVYRDSTGKPIRMVGTNVDITERKRADDALKLERARLRATLDSMPLAVWISDSTGRIIRMNDKAKTIWGDNAPLSQRIEEYEDYKGWWPDTGVELHAQDWAMSRALAKGETIVAEEVNIQRFDGSHGTILNNAAPIRDDKGNVIGAVVVEQDITGRKRAEEALRKTADELGEALRKHEEVLAQLNSLLANAPIGFAFFDREHRYAKINDYLAGEINGLPVEAHLGRTIGELLPINAMAVDPLLDRVFESGEPIENVEVMGETPAAPGEPRYWLTAWFPVRMPGGDVPYVGAAVMEITGQRKLQEALRQSEQKFRAMFEQAAIGMGRVRFSDARWIDVNEAFCRMLGYPPDELCGIAWPSITHPEDIDVDWVQFRQMAEGKLENYTVEKRFIHKIGHHVWARLTLSVVRDSAGRPDYEVAIIEDISSRKKTEEALSQSEERLRAIFENAGVGICEVDSDDRFIALNDMACRTLGRSREQLLTMNVHQATWPEDRELSDRINQEVHAGKRSRIEYEKRYLRADGTPVWAHVTVTGIRDSGGKWIKSVTTIEDITQRKYAQEELAAAKLSAERAKVEAEHANRAKDHFLAVLSHELRTPLTPVVMGVSMLQDNPGLDPQTRETLDMVRQNVDMEARLIDDLLDVTRIARGKFELSRNRVEIDRVIQRAVDVCKPDIEARRLHFGVDTGPGAPYWVDADPSRLQQVFWNLLKNAIKFTPHGGCVGIRCRLKDNDIVIDISDSGIGIEPEALSRVFDAFEQAERSITRQFGGLGLGLAISKALVEMHGGSIEAHSQGRDKGATFRVRLPRSAPAHRQEHAADDMMASHWTSPLRILLVEDHGVSARMIKMVLQERGHSVKIAGDVETALELAEGNHFDLLVSDLGLPDGSGHDLIRKLRSRGYNFPAIALSGYGQEEDIRRSHEAGFKGHIIKPASREAIYGAISSITGSYIN